VVAPANALKKASKAPPMLNTSVKLDRRLTISISEAAHLLGVKSKTIYNQLSAGSCPLPTFKFGGRRLIRVVDLIQLVGSGAPPESGKTHIEQSSTRF
jgi:excisionase family DNA binding protein